MPTTPIGTWLAGRWRRFSLVRFLTRAFAIVLAAQAVTSMILLAIAKQRKRRRPAEGFPHLEQTEFHVGENALRLYSYGMELYDAMLEAIDGATETIFFETYIWKGDAIGEEFKQHLIRKAREGVAVYVIFDTFGNLVVPRAFKRFPPEVHAMSYSAIRRPWHLLDPRRYALDHRKMLIVDGMTGFIGGYNIGSLYATEWRDTQLRVRGRAAADLAQSFVDFWNRRSSRSIRMKSHYRRRFDPLISLRGTDALRLTFPIRDMYIEAIDRAEHNILLTNAYFVPDHILLDALKGASQRGVDVQILLPWQSNHVITDWVARGYFTECLRAGIRIFGYQQAMIHAKTCTIDGQWSTVGTANLDRLSSVGNYELNVEVYSDILAAQMEALFACDKTNARELLLEEWNKRGFFAQLSERVLAPLRVAM